MINFKNWLNTEDTFSIGRKTIFISMGSLYNLWNTIWEWLFLHSNLIPYLHKSYFVFELLGEWQKIWNLCLDL